MGMDTVEVKRLVDEYLEAQSLKILPQAPFGDAVREFVQKDDKHAMERFIQQSLSSQVKNMLSLDGDEEDLDSAMEKYKSQLEKRFKAGELKSSIRRKETQPKPDNWDSDLEGHWEDQPGVVQWEPESVEQLQAPAKVGRGRKTTSPDDEDQEMEDVEEEPVPKPRGRGKAAVKAAPAKAPAKATAKAPPKPAAKKPPAKGRGRKAAVFEEDDSDDDIAIDPKDASPEPPARRAAATRSQPARSQPSRTAASASKPKQSKLNFSQKASQAMEISDDEISDDPFETPVPPTTRKR